MKILICGNYGATNIGDEAILSGLLQLFSTQKFISKVTILSYNPAETTKVHAQPSKYFLPFGFRSLYRGIFQKELQKTLKSYKECDLFVLGGGGLFSNENWQAVALWALHVAVAKLFRKRIIFIGQTFEKIKSPIWHAIAQKALKSASFITTRDHESQAVITAEGLSNCQTFSDLAWILKKDSTKNLQNQYSNNKTRKKQIIVSLRDWKKSTEKILPHIEKFLETTAERGFKIVLMPFQLLKSNDCSLLEQLQTNLENKGIKSKIISPENPHEALEIIAQSFCVVGMRLHANIFAAITETPFIALSYSSKVANFCKETAMSDFCIDLETLSQKQSSLILKFEKLIQNYQQIQENLDQAGEKLANRAQQNLKVIESASAPADLK